MKPFSILVLACLIGGFMPTAKAERDPYVAIYDDVLQANADRSVERCSSLQQAIADPSEEKRHGAFVELAQAWARVEASYILGGYDMDAMDYPLMVDYFHRGKEDVHESLARLIEGDSPAAKALYKSSYKTLGALDDVMFSSAWSPRREALAKVIAGTVCRNLTRIRDGYREHRADYLDDPKKALSLLINAEIENIYKTRDWRIAQISGLTKQTLGKPSPQKQQYPYSQASWAAIGAIIATHQQLLAEEQQPNIATIAHRKKADEGLASIQEALRMTEQAYRDTPPDHAFGTGEMIPLVQGLLDVQNAFYRQLVGSIGVTANLIDADGD